MEVEFEIVEDDKEYMVVVIEFVDVIFVVFLLFFDSNVCIVEELIELVELY